MYDLEPDHLIMGMSALMFWGGRKQSEERMKKLSSHCGLDVSAGRLRVKLH